MMGIPLNIIIAYILGGITFLPLLLFLVFLHAYLTFPKRYDSATASIETSDSLRQPNDDERVLLSQKSADALLGKFQRSHEPDVAAGYFAVCREYVPGGVNGKPPERTTPAGAVIATESPSVYQSMYRSLFDRKQVPTLDGGKGNGKPIKKARNVFFVVLRHGHLMLYEDSEQLEVKHVISLEHHDVSLFAGEDDIVEGELWIKRNAIRLSRKARIEEGESKPFFLFSENCSDKEDFYFALLQNQEVKAGVNDNPPRPLQFEARDIIGLVQRLHSSEEQLQTRWINGLLGRLFLALYQTTEMDEFVRKKVTKKIARVKKPAFLSGIVLQKIGMGESAPQITNPRLKDLTIDGDCCAEADFMYNGNFRLEIAATARIDLGARFKVREVNLVLAVVVKKVRGHGLLKFKPPPSNRIWVTFEHMPEIEMSIEPIVSSRQITYGVILRAIESRIREVIAETVVLPHWDDSPFLDTKHQKFRGGIWANLRETSEATAKHDRIPDESPEEEIEVEIDGSDIPSPTQVKDERSISTPILSDSPDGDLVSKTGPGLAKDLTKHDGRVTSTDDQRSDRPPRVLRSTSFASAADPLLSNTNADFVKREKNRSRKRQQDATSSMMAISNRSRPTSPKDSADTTSQFLQAARESVGNSSNGSSAISRSNGSADQYFGNGTLSDSPDNTPGHTTPSSASSRSMKSIVDRQAVKAPAPPQSSSTRLPQKRQSIAALGAATAAAKKWGWSVLARNADQKNGSVVLSPDRAGTPANPIGRGQPLPPPGQPLPSPNAQRSKTMPSPSPKRKPVPLPLQALRHHDLGNLRSSPAPPLPARRRQSSLPMEETSSDGLLVVEAPISEPPSPSESAEEHNNSNSRYETEREESGGSFDLDTEGAMDLAGQVNSSESYQKSFREDEEAPAIWSFAQEEEHRSKSLWLDTQEAC